MKQSRLINRIWRGAAALIAMISSGCAQKVNYPVENPPTEQNTPTENTSDMAVHEDESSAQQQKFEDEAVIHSYTVNINIRGMFAEVVQEMNINGPDVWRPIWDEHKGFLDIPIPENATVNGYAIEVDNLYIKHKKMLDAVVVDLKHNAFTEVRDGYGKGFKDYERFYLSPSDENKSVRSENQIRVDYPSIRRYESRNMRISYVIPLNTDADGNGKISVPLYHKNIQKHDIHISIDMPGVKQPSVVGLGDRSFSASGDKWILEQFAINDQFGEKLDITVPSLPDEQVLVEQMPDDPDDKFFAVSFKTKQPANAPERDLSKVRIIWDASGSRSPEDIQNSLNIIRLLPETGTYELHVLHNVLEPKKNFGTRQKLIDYLQELIGDGGTDYAGLQAVADVKFDGPTLFFTDGINTLSDELPEFGPGSAAIVSAKYYDYDKLNRMCGGHVYLLNNQTSEAIIDSIRRPELRIAAIKGSSISHVQGIGTPAGERILVTGRWTGASDTVEITLSDGSVYSTKLDPGKLRTGKLLATAWAASRVDQLAPFSKRNEDELRLIGRKYSVVSPVTTMIVFDHPMYYAAYNIEPPKDLKEIHSYWEKAHERLLTLRDNKIDEQAKLEHWGIEHLRNLCEPFVEWQKKPIPPNLTRRYECHEVCDDTDDDSSSCKDECFEVTISDYGEHYRVPFKQPKGFICDKAHNCEYLTSGSWGSLSIEPALYGPLSVSNENCIYDIAVPFIMSYHKTYEYHKTYGLMERDKGITFDSYDDEQLDKIDKMIAQLKTAHDKGAKAESLYAEYLRLRNDNKDNGDFYLNMVEFFFEKHYYDYGLRILSNFMEYTADGADASLWFFYSYIYRLIHDNMLNEAIQVAQIAVRLHPNDKIHSFEHDLAVALDLRARKNLDYNDAYQALENYKQSIMSFKMDTMGRYRYSSPETISPIIEFNNLASWAKRQKWANKPALPKLDEAISLNHQEADLRIVLHNPGHNEIIVITEPTTEQLSVDKYIGHRNSAKGGFIIDNEYFIQIAPRGKYDIGIPYDVTEQYKEGDVIFVDIFRNWGRANQTHQSIIYPIDLESLKRIADSEDVKDKAVIMLGTIKI